MIDVDYKVWMAGQKIWIYAYENIYVRRVPKEETKRIPAYTAFENNTHDQSAPQFVSVSVRKHLLHMPIGDASARHAVLNHFGRILVVKNYSQSVI